MIVPHQDLKESYEMLVEDSQLKNEYDLGENHFRSEVSRSFCSI